MWGRLICLFVLPIFPPIDLDGFGGTINNTSLPSQFMYKVNKIEEPDKRKASQKHHNWWSSSLVEENIKSWEKCWHFFAYSLPTRAQAQSFCFRQVALCIITINRDLQKF